MARRTGSLFGLVLLTWAAWALRPAHPLLGLLDATSADPVGQAVSAAAWYALAALVVWSDVVALLALLAVLPGAAGRLARRVAWSLLPRVVAPTVAAALGLAVATGPAAAADPVSPPGPVPVASAIAADGLVSLDRAAASANVPDARWPLLDRPAGAPDAGTGTADPVLPGAGPAATPRPTPAPEPAPAPEPGRTTQASPSPGQPASTAPSPPSAPSDSGPPPATSPVPAGPGGAPTTAGTADPSEPVPRQPPAAGPPSPARRAGPVTVRPGDCLWSIAQAWLGPDAGPASVAAAWPRWYQANRAVIGPDPNLIMPGQHLVPPD